MKHYMITFGDGECLRMLSADEVCVEIAKNLDGDDVLPITITIDE